MATLTIRDLDDELRAQLRVRAARHGRSMEAEVRAILRETLARPQTSVGLGSRIRERFAAVGGFDVEPTERLEQPPTPTLPE